MAILKPDKIRTEAVAGGEITIKEKIIPDTARAAKYVAAYVPKGGKMKPCALLNNGTGKPKGVTVHNTAAIKVSGTSMAEQYTRATWPNCNMGGPCVHFFVSGTEIWQNLDEKEQGWHAADGSRRRTDHRGGKTGGNVDTIAIEVIGNGADTENTAAKLVAYLCRKYGLDPVLDVYTHNYWMWGVDKIVQGKPKNCPLYILPHWGDFLAAAARYTEKRDEPTNAGAPDFIAALAPLAQADAKENNLLASLTMAQAILESAYGTSELAVNANNLFGIKAGANWTGKTYTKTTKEYINGQYTDVVANFRAYDTMAACVADRAKKLTTEARYKNLVGCMDIKTACERIQADGWATSPAYTTSLLQVVEKYSLTKYDTAPEQPQTEAPDGYLYTLQMGAFAIKANCQQAVKDLATKGITAFASYQAPYWRAQCGAYKYKTNAEAEAAKLKARGIAVIVKLKKVA